MWDKQVKPAVLIANTEHSSSRFLIMLSLLLMTITVMLVSVTPVYATSACCMQNEFMLVTQKGVQTVSFRHDWITRTERAAQSAYKDGDYYLAKRLWAALANEGHADSAYKLGMLYDMGEHVAYDSGQAVYWYQHAAEQGHRQAQHNLAVAYANGEGVELDISMALKWWQLAALQGNPDSQYNLGIIFAMGSHGVQKNLDKAKQWWRKAAINGDALAQYNLGTLYANGEGHVRSYCEATRWWEKSADAGVKQASWALEVIKTHREYSACW